MNKIFFLLLLFFCAKGVSAQQNTSAPATLFIASNVTVPHWFTQEQLREMNPKHRMSLRNIFSRRTARHTQKNNASVEHEAYAIHDTTTPCKQR